jgi:hypothetical protein
MTMRRQLALLGGVLAALALVAAGCGGSTAGSSSSSGAQFVRADALAFASIDTDFGSSQWKQLDTLSKKFPGRDQAIQSIEQGIAGHGLDFQNDIEPALGPEFDFAVAAGSTPSDITAVGLTQPSDGSKFEALVQKGNAADPSSKSVFRKLGDGWYAIGNSQAAIDKVLASSGDSTLADESLYKDAVAAQPSETLANAYVNGSELGKLIQDAMQARGSSLSGSSTSGLDNLDFVSASLTAENDGVRVHGVVQGAGASQLGGDYTSQLLGETPSDAFAFLSFKGGKNLGSGLSQLSVPLESALGVPLQDVLDLFANENALYVKPGAVIPEITAILQPDDTAKGMATLTKIATKLAAGPSGATLSGGAAEKTLSFGTQFELHFGVKDGKIVITSAAGGIASVGSPSQSLADSADFQEASKAADLPSSTGGLLYIDLKNAIPLIEGFAGLAGQHLPAEVTGNLQPLRSFLAWTAGSGNSRTFDLFLEIQ